MLHSSHGNMAGQEFSDGAGRGEIFLSRPRYTEQHCQHGGWSMIRGKGTHIAVGVLVLLLGAGSASAVPTFPLCLAGAYVPPWMTSSHTFDPVLTGAPGSDAGSRVQGTPLVWTPQGQAATITVSDSATLPTIALDTPIGDSFDIREVRIGKTVCQVPSPGTLLLGAMGAFLVGALRMRRML